MSLTADQIISSQKAGLETLFGLTTKAFEGVEKLVELNVTASKAALSEAAGTTQALLSVKDAQELLSLQASLFQPLAEKTAAYSRHLYDIASGTTAEFGKQFEGQVAEVRSPRRDEVLFLERDGENRRSAELAKMPNRAPQTLFRAANHGVRQRPPIACPKEVPQEARAGELLVGHRGRASLVPFSAEATTEMPKIVEFRPDLPKTATRKIQRIQLR